MVGWGKEEQIKEEKMFTRAEALDFAFERGLKGANFVHHRERNLAIWYWEGRNTQLWSGGTAEVTPMGAMAAALKGRGDGWFVSAKVNKAWMWFFDNGDEVPHGR